MNKRSAIIASMALVATLGVGAFAVSNNLGPTPAEAMTQAKDKQKHPKPIVKRRTIKRHRTVRAPGGATQAAVVVSRGTGSGSGGSGNSHSGASFSDDDGGVEHESEDQDREEHESGEDEGGGEFEGSDD